MSKYKYELYKLGDYYKCRRIRLKDGYMNHTALFNSYEYSYYPKVLNEYSKYGLTVSELTDSVKQIGTYYTLTELKEEMDSLMLIEELKK